MASIGALSASLTAAESEDQRFLAGLRERALYRLAETFCQNRLSDAALPESRRSELTIELSKTFVAHALASNNAERDSLWQRAHDTIDDYQNRHPKSRRLLIVDVQGGLVWLTRGELMRQQAELTGDDRQLLSEARSHLRTAISQLEAADAKIARELRQSAPRRGVSDEILNEAELRSLKNNVRFELARAYRNQGQSYPTNSPDRIAALTKAGELLGPLAQMSTVDPLAWRSRIGSIEVLRLSNEFAAATRQVTLLLEQGPPPEIALKARAQQVHVALDMGNVDEALDHIAEGRSIEGKYDPELDYAVLKAYLAKWLDEAKTDKPSDSAVWRKRTEVIVREIHTRHSADWGRRADALLAAVVTKSPGIGNPGMLVQAAEGYYRGGQLDEAVAAYDAACERLKTEGQRHEAFDVAYVAATIEHERKHYDEAVRRYRQLAVSMPEHERAAEAHLLAIFNEGQRARSQEPVSLTEYTRLLEEHLRTWPEAPGADTARLWLGKVREAEHDWRTAVEVYGEITPGGKHYSEALRSIARCYDAWLAERHTAGQATDKLVETAARYFMEIASPHDQKRTEPYTDDDRFAALVAARLWMHQAEHGLHDAGRVLEPLLADPDAPQEWRSAALAVMIVALAGQGKSREATEALDQMAGESPDGLFLVFEQLAELSATADGDLAAKLAQLQLNAAQHLANDLDRLDEAQRERYDLFTARALSTLGRRAEAINLLERLAAAHPRNGTIQEELAAALSDTNDPATLKAALVQWRQVERKSRPGDDRWFRAKYQVARTLVRMNRKQDAAEIIRLTQVLHPDMGGEEMKARFEQLLVECER